MSYSQKTYLEAHVAARLVDVPEIYFDRYNLPIKRRKLPKFTLRKPLARLAFYLKAKIPLLFQECQVTIEDRENSMFFRLENITNTRGLPSEQGDVLLSTPLVNLVDVSINSSMSSSVNTTAVTSLRTSQAAACSSHTRRSTPYNAESESLARQNGTISNFFRVHEELGISLIFATTELAQTSVDVSTRHFTKVSMRFTRQEDHVTWATFFRSAYVTLLLESVRNGCCGSTLGATNSESLSKKERYNNVSFPILAQDALDSYVDFFQSNNLKASATHASIVTLVEHTRAPCNGEIYVATADDSRAKRLISIERHHKDGSNESKEWIDFLIIYKEKSLSRYLKRKSITLRIPVHDITVFVVKNLDSGIFFLQYRKSNSASAEPNLGALSAYSTVHLDAGTFANRCKWMRWLERVLDKVPVYLSDHHTLSKQNVNTQDATFFQPSYQMR